MCQLKSIDLRSPPNVLLIQSISRTGAEETGHPFGLDAIDASLSGVSKLRLMQKMHPLSPGASRPRCDNPIIARALNHLFVDSVNRTALFCIGEF